MNIKKIPLFAMILALGLLLHYLVPSVIFGGMKMDFLLGTLFIGLLMADSYQEAIMLGGASGILAALTTTFPGGQIPNILDKVTAAVVVYTLLHLIFTKQKDKVFTIIICTIIGTIVSGLVFLTSAKILLGGLPVSFQTLFLTVVIPATIGNVGLVVILQQALLRVKSLFVVFKNN